MLQEFESTTRAWLRFYQPKLDKFAERFKENPTAALEWSAEVFEAAARVEVATYVSTKLMNAKDPEDAAKRIVAALHNDVLTATRWPSRSTSVPSNEMALCLAAAKADFIASVTPPEN